MKLQALKKISAQLPKGTEFELSERKGKILLALKLAKAIAGRDTATPRPIDATPVEDTPDPPSASPEPAKRGRYARRDLRAK